MQTAVDINALIRDVAELMNIDARMAQAEVRFELAEPLPPVVGDRIQLEQVMVNLMRNALRGGGGVRAGASPADHPHDRRTAANICVDVRRHGASAFRRTRSDRVFDRFFTTKPHGMGMGLPISQSIIENHGGSLWVTPRRGGAHVSISHCRSTGESITVEAEPTVFIIDDDPAVRQALTVLVRSMHLRAEAYESAQQFLDAFDRSRPGCLLLDVRMPGISGLELLEQLGRDERHMPAIVMSAYGDVPMVVRAMKAGALNFLEKPCRDQQLWEAIQEGLRWDAAHRQHVVLQDKVRHRLTAPYARRTRRAADADRRQIEQDDRRRVGR